MSTARSRYSLATLPNGKVLIAGGFSTIQVVALTSSEIYDPATGN